MRGWVLAWVGLWALGVEPSEATLERFAALALRCVEQPYPNKLDHVQNGPHDVAGPEALHPAFYGCFDWHSAVHAHWLMVHALRRQPDLSVAPELRRVLDAHLRPETIAVEVAYLGQPQRASFERTYGWAWLLKLAAELKTWEDPDARRWERALRPLAEAFVARWKAFLPKQTYPIRTGVHPNSAYSLSLALDHAQAYGDVELEGLIRSKALGWFGRDRRAPLAWEPSGEDFLSPSLEEAALMARVMPPRRFRTWLRGFLPDLMRGGDLAPAVVSDRRDPKIVHLDGLNLSRARCLYRLAAALDPRDPARAHLRRLAEAHARASLPHIASGNYEGEHWLGTFAAQMLEAQRADVGRRGR